MTVKKTGNIFTRISNSLISTFESIFKRTGSFIGRHPIICITTSLIIAIGFGSGLFLINQENRREKLWLPAESDNQDYLEYVADEYKDPFFEIIIFENENILTPESLKSMLELDEIIKEINVGKSWESICFRFGENCYVSSILELWGFNKTIIESLTLQDIIDKINEPKPISLVTQRKVNVASLLGGVDNETYITVAKAARATYGLSDNRVFDEDEGRKVDKYAEDWEMEFIDIGNDDYEGVTVYGLAFRSFDIESGNTISDDLTFLVFGYILLFIYITVMLSKYTLIEHRIYLAICGIVTVGMAIVVAIGLSSIIGLIYTPVHSVLPFLLLGIGVDDMFVIVQAWDNLSDDEKKKPIHEQCSEALKHAGVSITVTSVTDFSAFLIGATTVLPALRSFCVFCGIGIIFLFFFSILFFTATLSLDQKRVTNNRDACCCCIVHGDDYQPSECGQKNRFEIFVEEIFAPALVSTPIKILVIVITVCLLGFGIWGFVELEQFFNFRWFLPSDSYATAFLEANDLYYPNSGEKSSLYLNNIDFFRERSTIEAFYNNATNDPYIDPTSFTNWYEDYKLWIRDNKWNEAGYNNVTMWPDTENTFYIWLLEFLDDPAGGDTYRSDLKFNNGILESSRISFSHVVLRGSTEEVDAMDSIQDLARGFEFEGDGFAFAFSEVYLQYESNKVIQEELYRNMGLACVCVFVIILLLLADLLACCLVSLSVLLTLIDLAGFIHHWGLTIDVVVTIQLILSIGIAVDYAAHIGHTFMTVTGTRNDRVLRAVKDIGPAVLNGGLSTLLAFVLLSLSTSYVFKTFFKIFLLVVIFGMFHGLVLLPVLLSWFGPAPYESATEEDVPPAIVVSDKTQTTNNGDATDVSTVVSNSIEKVDFDNPAYEGINGEKLNIGKKKNQRFSQMSIF